MAQRKNPINKRVRSRVRDKMRIQPKPATERNSDKTKPGQTDRVELLRRIRIVEELLITGASAMQIWQYLTNSGGVKGSDGKPVPLEVSERTVRRYVTIAYKHLSDKADIDRRAEVALARKQYNLVFNLAVSPGKGKSKDLRSAVQAVSGRSKLLGLDAPTKIDARHGSLPDTEEGTLEELERILDA